VYEIRVHSQFLVSNNHFMNAHQTADLEAPLSSTRTRLSWPHLVLCALGFATSAYALIEHLRLKAGESSGCGFTATIDCAPVLTSKYAEFFHIPLGIWGMVFFALMALTATWKEATATRWRDERRARSIQLAFAACGLATSVLLTIVSYTQLHAFCPICLSTHAVTTTLFFVSLWLFFRTQPDTTFKPDTKTS
jgi:uncharacterized membrane protein